MEQRTISVYRLAHILIIIVLGYLILTRGQFFLIPLIFAVLLAIMLQPVSKFFERLVRHRVPAALLTILTVLTGLGIIITLISVQLTAIIYDLDNVTVQINQGLHEILNWLNDNLGLKESDIRESFPNLTQSAVGFVQKGISSVTGFIFNLFFVLLLVFFLLWYQNNFRKLILLQANKQKPGSLEFILIQIQATMRKYLYGLLTVIAILAVLNSAGLMIIGIKYAIFWGVLAAFLAIIPYIGTTLGGTLPFLYAVATSGNWWQPIAVVGMYVIIQQLEGNIITPKVVGKSVSINPLIALLSIILGGFIWGVAGIILAIPIVGVIKILLDHNPRTRPIGFLLGNQMSSKGEDFWKEMETGPLGDEETIRRSD
jgi:predicted PurR-regulated permease PerM